MKNNVLKMASVAVVLVVSVLFAASCDMRRTRDNINSGYKKSTTQQSIRADLENNLKELSKRCWYLRIEKSSNSDNWVVVAKTDDKSYYGRNIDLLEAVGSVLDYTRD